MRSLEVSLPLQAPPSPAPPDTAPHSSPSVTGGAGPASPDSEKLRQSEDHRGAGCSTLTTGRVPSRATVLRAGSYEDES
jgi:hypothetical protein